ncbi:MAG TPA: hypothetical protein VMR45_04520 [Patescibacteria group bacterium]|nr:hypothetical protein [Patescibacteria group bacterium]
MNVARELKARLGHVASVVGLPEGHFSIDTSGSPLTVVEGTGAHTLLPTHFEAGSYFNQPHADHQLDYPAERVPRLQVGPYVRFGGKVGINAGGDVKIGTGAWFAPGSYVLLQDHSGYERPSVGARTVASTRLPGITVEDYAMVGRQSMVKWDVDYIGRGAVVAMRSTIGKEVGDYSIVGDRDKVLGYLPYRAAFIEYGKPSFEDLLKISDWGQVKSDWLKQHSRFMSEAGCTNVVPAMGELLRTVNAKRRATMLDMNPGIGNNMLEASRLGISVTGVAPTREMFPVILQRAEDAHTYNLKLRGEVSPTDLPYKDGGKDALRNSTAGFNLVLNVQRDPSTPQEEMCAQLSEAARVAAPGGDVVLGYSRPGDAGSLIWHGSERLGLTLAQETTDQDTDGQLHHLLVFRKKG